MSEIEYQRKLLGDPERNQAFYAALAKTIVKDQTTLVDVGAGTGFLSFLALHLGAKHCTLIEYSATLELAKKLAKRNRLRKLGFVRKHSSEVRKLSADVVMSETLGNYALEEGLIETLNDAQRFLKKGGVLIPAALRQFVAPVIKPHLQAEIDIWPQIGFALDLSPAREVALNNMYVKRVLPADIGGDAAIARCWDRMQFAAGAARPASLRQSQQSWKTDDLLVQAGARQVYGYVLWWEAELVPGVVLGTSPFSAPTHWEQVYLPLLEPVPLKPKQQLELTLKSDTRAGVRVGWHTRLMAGGKCLQEIKQDLRKGRL